MIRGFDPAIKYSSEPIGQQVIEPEWKSELKRNIHYLAGTRWIYKVVAGGCGIANKISHLKPLAPVANTIKSVVKPLGDAAKMAGIYTTMEDFASYVQEGKLGYDLHSAQEILNIFDKGIELVSWFSMIDKLGITLRVVSSLPSISLATALLSPTLDLMIHLREEGWDALNGMECYKTSYKLGLALLAVYLFMASVTLSAHLEIAITGINFALLFV